MAEWGRKEYLKAWPSRTPIWSWAAIVLSFVFFGTLILLKYQQSWTASERLYLSDYLKSGVRSAGSATAQSNYTLLEAEIGKRQRRLLVGNEIEPVADAKGRQGYRLTDEGVRHGISKLTWETGTFKDRGVHHVMSEAIFAEHEAWDFYQLPVYGTFIFFLWRCS